MDQLPAQARIRELCARRDWSGLLSELTKMPLSVLPEVMTAIDEIDSRGDVSAGTKPAALKALQKMWSRLPSASSLLTSMPGDGPEWFGGSSNARLLHRFEENHEHPQFFQQRLSLSSDASRVACSNFEKPGTVQIYDTSSGEHVSELSSSSTCIGVSLSRDGKLAEVTTLNENHAIKRTLWDVDRGNVRCTFQELTALPLSSTRYSLNHAAFFSAMQGSPLPSLFSFDNSAFVTSIGNAVHVYCCESGDLLLEIPAPGICLSLSTTRDHLVIGSFGQMVFCSLPFGTIERSIVEEEKSFIGYVPGGRERVVCAGDETLSVLDGAGKSLRSWKIRTLRRGSIPNSSCGVPEKCRYVCIADPYNGEIQLFHPQDGTITFLRLNLDLPPLQNGRVNIATADSGVAATIGGALWFCPEGARSSASSWTSAVKNLSSRPIGECSDNDLSTIRTIAENGWWSDRERALLNLWERTLVALEEHVHETVVSVAPDSTVSPDIDYTVDESSEPSFEVAGESSVPDEATLARVLAGEPDCSLVWGWIPFASPAVSLQLLRYLTRQHWQPDNHDNAIQFQKLCELAGDCIDTAHLDKAIVDEEPFEVRHICRTESAPRTSDPVKNRNQSIFTDILVTGDSQWLITTCPITDGGFVRSWSLPDGKMESQFVFLRGSTYLQGIALNPSGCTLALETYVQRFDEIGKPFVTLLDGPDFAIQTPLEEDKESASAKNSLLFSSTGRYLFTTTRTAVTVWNMESKERLSTFDILPQDLDEDAEGIRAIASDREEKLFAVALVVNDSAHAEIQLRSIGNGQLIATQNVFADLSPGARHTSLHFGPDFLLVVSGANLSIWSIPDLQPMATSGVSQWKRIERWLVSSLSPAGNLLALASSWTVPILLISLPSFEIVDTLTGDFSGVHALTFDRTGSSLYAGTSNGAWCFAPKKNSVWKALRPLIDTPMSLLRHNGLDEFSCITDGIWLSSSQRRWLSFLRALANQS